MAAEYPMLIFLTGGVYVGPTSYNRDGKETMQYHFRVPQQAEAQLYIPSVNKARGLIADTIANFLTKKTAMANIMKSSGITDPTSPKDEGNTQIILPDPQLIAKINALPQFKPIVMLLAQKVKPYQAYGPGGTAGTSVKLYMQDFWLTWEEAIPFAQEITFPAPTNTTSTDQQQRKTATAPA